MQWGLLVRISLVAAFMTMIPCGTLHGDVRAVNAPTQEGSYPRFLAVAGPVAYFATEDSMGRQMLWKTDGSEAGTVIVGESIGFQLLSPA